MYAAQAEDKANKEIGVTMGSGAVRVMKRKRSQFIIGIVGRKKE